MVQRKRYCQIILNQERTLKWKFIRFVVVNKKRSIVRWICDRTAQAIKELWVQWCWQGNSVQLIQNCKSNQLRRHAFRESDKGLQDILDLGRLMEISGSQAVQAMERESTVSVNKAKQTTTCCNCRGPFPHRNNHCPAKPRRVMLVRIQDILGKCVGARIDINLQLRRWKLSTQQPFHKITVIRTTVMVFVHRVK